MGQTAHHWFLFGLTQIQSISLAFISSAFSKHVRNASIGFVIPLRLSECIRATLSWHFTFRISTKICRYIHIFFKIDTCDRYFMWWSTPVQDLSPWMTFTNERDLYLCESKVRLKKEFSIKHGWLWNTMMRSTGRACDDGLYKVVQIWPGLFVCKQVTVCPGHIWTTLYVCRQIAGNLRVCNKQRLIQHLEVIRSEIPQFVSCLICKVVLPPTPSPPPKICAS